MSQWFLEKFRPYSRKILGTLLAPALPYFPLVVSSKGTANPVRDAHYFFFLRKYNYAFCCICVCVRDAPYVPPTPHRCNTVLLHLRWHEHLKAPSTHTYFLTCVFASRHQNVGRSRANTKKLGGCLYIPRCVPVSVLVNELVYVKYGHHCIHIQGDAMGDPQKQIEASSHDAATPDTSQHAKHGLG